MSTFFEKKLLKALIELAEAEKRNSVSLTLLREVLELHSLVYEYDEETAEIFEDLLFRINIVLETPFMEYSEREKLTNKYYNIFLELV